MKRCICNDFFFFLENKNFIIPKSIKAIFGETFSTSVSFSGIQHDKDRKTEISFLRDSKVNKVGKNDFSLKICILLT